MTDTPGTELQVPEAEALHAVAVRADLIEKLDWVEGEARLAFERSRRVVKTSKGNGPPKQVYSEALGSMVYADAAEEMVYSPGDPRFLTQVERCVMAKAKLLGLKEPGPGEYVSVEKVRAGWDGAMHTIRAALEAAIKEVAPALCRPRTARTIRVRLKGAVLGAFDKALEGE